MPVTNDLIFSLQWTSCLYVYDLCQYLAVKSQVTLNKRNSKSIIDLLLFKTF